MTGKLIIDREDLKKILIKQICKLNVTVPPLVTEVINDCYDEIVKEATSYEDIEKTFENTKNTVIGTKNTIMNFFKKK